MNNFNKRKKLLYLYPNNPPTDVIFAKLFLEIVLNFAYLRVELQASPDQYTTTTVFHSWFWFSPLLLLAWVLVSSLTHSAPLLVGTFSSWLFWFSLDEMFYRCALLLVLWSGRLKNDIEREYFSCIVYLLMSCVATEKGIIGGSAAPEPHGAYFFFAPQLWLSGKR